MTYVNPHATQVKYLNPNPLLDPKPSSTPSQPAPLPPMPIGEVPMIPILPKSDSETELPSIHSIKRDSGERIGKNLVMNGKSMSSFTFTVSNNDDVEKQGSQEGSKTPPRKVVKNPLFVDRNKIKKGKIEKLAEKMKLKSKTSTSGLLGDKPMRGRSRSPSDYSDSPDEKRGKVRNYDLDSPERRKSKASIKIIKKARDYDRDLSTDSKSEYSSDSDYKNYKKSNKRKSVENHEDSRKSSRKSVFDRMGEGPSKPDKTQKLSKSLEKRLSSKESRDSPERKPERSSGRSNSERIQSEIRDVLSESNLKVTKKVKVVKKSEVKKYQSSDSDEKMLDSSGDDFDIGVKDVRGEEDESDKLKRLTQQIEDRISKTIDSNSQILRGLRTPAEEEKKIEKVPLLPLPVENITEPDDNGDFLDVDAGSSAHEETSEVSESRPGKAKSSNDSGTREKQRRMQHDFFNTMAKKRQPGDVPLRKAHAHSLIAKSQGGSGIGRNSGKNSGMNSPAADI